MRLSTAIVPSALLSLAAMPAAASPITVTVNLFTPNSTSGAPALVFDVDGDSTSDIEFRYTGTFSYYSSDGDLFAFGLNGSEVSLTGPLALNALIDASLGFATVNHMTEWDQTRGQICLPRGGCQTITTSTVGGTWHAGNNFSIVTGYLGFRMPAGSTWRYGWADITSYSSGLALINRYGYETVPGRGIRAGAGAAPQSIPLPPSLALLAVGALGVAAAQRRRRQAA